MLTCNLARVVLFRFASVLLFAALAACSGAADDPQGGTRPATPEVTATLATSPSPLPTPTAFPATSTHTPAPVQEQMVRLPDDEGPHFTDLEWWYFNGHLAAEDGQEFSYHFVTFQSVLPSGLTTRLAQLSWADHLNGLHLIEENAELPVPEESLGEFDVPVADWEMSGNGENYGLSFGIGDYSVDLKAVSRKPAVLHNSTGLVDLGIAGKTYYYSRTRLETSGTVTIAGVAHPVTGTSWMDHQWGDFTTMGIGWDWLSLNLDDGSDLTISVVWEQDGREPIDSYGTYVPAGSPPVHLPGSEISLQPTGTWTSADTGGVYPMNWELRVDSLGLDLALTPTIEEAEFALSAFVPIIYWEGSISAMGTKDGGPVAGRGFVEMVGYAPTPEIQATLPAQP